METTGIVRRIDDLGRIVIPKEIRRTVGIREGDPLMISVTENSVIFQRINESTVEEDLTKFLSNHCDLDITVRHLIEAAIELSKK